MSVAESSQINQDPKSGAGSAYDVPAERWSWLPSSMWGTVALAAVFGGLMFVFSFALDWFMIHEHDTLRSAIEASDLLAGTVAAILFFLFLRVQRERRAMLRRRVEVIAGMNHHVRNALQVISLSAFSSADQQQLMAIRESMNRIQWALRELLPKL